jgi:hypothetical protein
MDKTYLERIKLRRQVIAMETKNVVEVNPVATDAVKELYEWVIGVYLPKRFPNMFSLLPHEVLEGKQADGQAGGYLHNLVTDEHIPLVSPLDPVEALKILGSHVDNDFLLLLPTPDPNATLIRVNPTPDPPCPYYLHAYILTFPSGFNTSKKFGLPLAGMSSQ